MCITNEVNCALFGGIWGLLTAAYVNPRRRCAHPHREHIRVRQSTARALFRERVTQTSDRRVFKRAWATRVPDSPLGSLAVVKP